MDETVKQMGISATLTLPIFPEVGPTTIFPLVTIDDPSILESHLTAQYKKSFYASLQQQQVDGLAFTCQIFLEEKY